MVNVYALIAVGLFLVVVGVGGWLLYRKLSQPKAGSDPSLGVETTPDPQKGRQEPKLGRIPGWVGLGSNELALGLYNRAHMAAIEAIWNKDGTKLRLRIKMSNGQVVYSPPADTEAELYQQIRDIMKA